MTSPEELRDRFLRSEGLLDPEPGQAAFVYDDGGREAAGFRGSTGDCAARAVAIATQIPYREACDRLNALGYQEIRRRRRRSDARLGVWRDTLDALLSELGFEWTPTMKVGEGCRVHLRADELPPGRLVVRLSRHYAAVIDGELHDTHDSSRAGTRCVYGFWARGDTR